MIVHDGGSLSVYRQQVLTGKYTPKPCDRLQAVLSEFPTKTTTSTAALTGDPSEQVEGVFVCDGFLDRCIESVFAPFLTLCDSLFLGLGDDAVAVAIIVAGAVPVCECCHAAVSLVGCGSCPVLDSMNVV